MASNPFSTLNSSHSLAGPSQSSNRSAPGQNSKKKHRAGRKHKRPRRKSFALPAETGPGDEQQSTSARENPRDSLYIRGRNLSNTSIDSEVLLDHRDHPYTRPRRPSTLTASFNMPQSLNGRSRTMPEVRIGEEDADEPNNERAPLLPSPGRLEPDSTRGYGSNAGLRRNERSLGSINRRGSSRSSRRQRLGPSTPSERYNINYPPSMPGSPTFGPTERVDLGFDDVMMGDDLVEPSRPNSMMESEGDPLFGQSPFERRHTIAIPEEDVCFPQEGMSEIADDELQPTRDIPSTRAQRRRRNRWPDLSILEQWSQIEKEDRSDERRMKKIIEPQLVNGRLRPVHKGWFRAEEDAPYRFTYFNDELQDTIHSQTISELVQSDSSFKELFVPEPTVLSDSSDSEDDELLVQISEEGPSMAPTRQPSLATTHVASESKTDNTLSPKEQSLHSGSHSREESVRATPTRARSPFPGLKPGTSNESKKPRYGDRPVWWLDVLSPTESEMRVLAKAFGIHPLTTEDIMLQEQREKVELFRHYYFVNYRSFDQDANSETHLDPVNMYVVVFREGVISFHFNQTPHPANVRRRIRQLKDYISFSSDWISYAIIDDITDVYLPLIQTIEEEVDDIDDRILQLHSSSDPASLGSSENLSRSENEKGAAEPNTQSDGDMLRRVGDCRKKVMSLYRLLGNKADVIKGFAKRCNEHWEVAPRSEIGLYLGDIQDHIVTMTANLSHYEMILARCHANYIAQINIRMNERQEQTADVLGKLTVLGTIVLPMNIITGLWGMNVWVPGQEYEGDLKWFFAITGGLLMFGLACFWIAKRVYGIV